MIDAGCISDCHSEEEYHSDMAISPFAMTILNKQERKLL